jgi:hypothetical protein
MVYALKVAFIKPLNDEDFVEKGMVAWLTDIEWDHKFKMYKLFFDFNDFEEENDKYFKETYYANKNTPSNSDRELFTAKEAGFYRPKYSVYFELPTFERDDERFSKEISNYLSLIIQYPNQYLNAL